MIKSLKATQLYHTCNEKKLGFKTTEDLKDLKEFLGQERAIDALSFGVGIKRKGFNLFVLGLEFAANLWDASLGDTSGWGVAYVLVLLGTTIPVLAVGARRLHDLNKSGWLQLLAITIIGLIPLIIWWATEGTKKSNSHGKPIKIKKK